MHKDAVKGTVAYTRETDHQLSLTPCSFTHLMTCFRHLFEDRVLHYEDMQSKYRAGLD